jgi:hypothetical protein
MSLRGFHVVFVTLAVALSLFFGAYEWSAFQQGHASVDITVSGISFGIALALAVYGVWFYRKSQKIIV